VLVSVTVMPTVVACAVSVRVQVPLVGRRVLVTSSGTMSSTSGAEPETRRARPATAQ
jgi:hypothetical protein